MIFEFLAASTKSVTNEDKILAIVLHFTNNLLEARPRSIQDKFLLFLKTSVNSQNFFKKCHKFLKMHQSKVSTGLLDRFFDKQVKTNNLTTRAYLMDVNLEKQIVQLFRNLCANGNIEIKDFVRD